MPQVLEMRMRKNGVRRSSSTGSKRAHQPRKSSSGSSREAGRGAQGAPPEHPGGSSRSRAFRKPGGSARSKKPKGKQDVWKDIPGHERNVHRVGAVGSRLPKGGVPLPEWPARPDNWPTKGQLDDEATFYIDRIPVKDMEWAIQQLESNGGFQCSDSGNLVKYKVKQHAEVSPSIAENVEEDYFGVGAGQ